MELRGTLREPYWYRQRGEDPRGSQSSKLAEDDSLKQTRRSQSS